MIKPLLIIIIGPVSAGKSTIGQKISEELSLPFVSKDTLKEIIFDAGGWEDKAYSKKVGNMAYSILFNFVENFLKISSSVIVEANFTTEHSAKKINYIIKKYNINSIQLNCMAEKGVLVKRFKQRNKLKLTHPGRYEDSIFEEIKDSLERGKVESLKIESEVLCIDTTNLEKVNYQKILKTLKSRMKY